MQRTIAMVSLDSIMTSLVEPIVERRAIGKVIAPLFSNSGFMPFLKNLLCSIDRVQATNYVVIAMDNTTCAPLQAGFGLARDPSAASACVYPYAHRPLTSGGIATYRSTEFNRMVMQRPMWMRHLLRKGYSVLQCDLDIVWLRNPFPLFAALPSFDLLLQSEGGHGYNAGFYFARPTEAVDDFMGRWMEDLIGKWGTHAFEEQHSLGRSLRGRGASRDAPNSSAPRLRYVKLNMTEVPNGKVWWSNSDEANKNTAHAIHVNWVKARRPPGLSLSAYRTPRGRTVGSASAPHTRLNISPTHPPQPPPRASQGNKKGRLVNHNLWWLEGADERCKSGPGSTNAHDPLEGGCRRWCARPRQWMPCLATQREAVGRPFTFALPARRRCRPIQYCQPGFEAGSAKCPYESCGKMLAPRAPDWHPLALAKMNCTGTRAPRPPPKPKLAKNKTKTHPVSDRARRCKEMHTTHAVKVRASWGTLPADGQATWKELRCDSQFTRRL